MQTSAHQGSWTNWLLSNPGKARFWIFYREGEETAYEPCAMGGLENIQWENGVAEMSLIVNPSMRRQGNGRYAFRWLLGEAFDRMRLNSVWSETYECNVAGMGFIDAIRNTYRFHTTWLPDRKYWDGKYVMALRWAINKERWDEIRSWHPGKG
jgi:RimJ/RimL family protein N-acetyltransferase